MKESAQPLTSNRNYRWWLLGDTSDQVGRGLQSISVPLVAVSLAGPAAAGVMSGVMDALAMLGMLLGGIVIQRYTKRRVLLRAAPIAFAAWLGVVLATGFGVLSFPVLFLLVAIAVFASSMARPSSEALVLTLVNPENQTHVLSAKQRRGAVMEMISGPISGFLLAAATVLPFAAQALTSAAQAVSAWRINAPETMSVDLQAPETLRTKARSAREGARWILSHPTTRTLALSALLLNLGFQAIIQTIIFSYRLDGLNPGVIGLVYAALALGILIGSLLSGRVVQRYRSGVLITACFAWLIVPATIIVTTRQPYFSAIALAMTGLVLPIISTIGFGFMMAAAPPQLQTRVYAGSTLIGSALLPLALIGAGFALQAWGHTLTLVAALIPISLGGLWVVLSSSVHAIPTVDQWQEFVASSTEFTEN